MSIPRWSGLAALLAVAAAPVGADIIDFKSPTFTVGDSLGPVVTATNTVTFSVDAGLDAFVHAYGPPQTAFAPDNTVAASVGYTTGGEQFLSDEPVAEDGLVSNLPYRFSFLNAITAISMDLLDFRDGGSASGDKIRLTAWANADFTSSVYFAELTILSGQPNANVIPFGVSGIPAFRSFTVEVIDLTPGNGITGDIGTGIDNVDFTTAVPEPASLVLLGSGLLGLGAFRRRRGSRS